MFKNYMQIKATGNSRSGIPGNSRESATSKIPGGNSREFLNFWRKILTFHKISNVSYFSPT